MSCLGPYLLRESFIHKWIDLRIVFIINKKLMYKIKTCHDLLSYDFSFFFFFLHREYMGWIVGIRRIKKFIDLIQNEFTFELIWCTIYEGSQCFYLHYVRTFVSPPLFLTDDFPSSTENLWFSKLFFTETRFLTHSYEYNQSSLRF